MLRPGLIVILALCAAGCGDSETAAPVNRAEPEPAARQASPGPLPSPAAETSPPPEEAAGRENGAEDAAAALRRYYALIEAGDYDAAWALRWHGAADDAESKAAFAKQYSGYSQYRVQVGEASPPSGAAGSLYVEIPVQIQGRTNEGEPFASVGTVTMRRVNDVPGATAEQKSWRVYSRD